MTGTDNAEYLIGDTGNDILTGGLGADVFVFSLGLSDDGDDTITDFDGTTDVLRFTDVIDVAAAGLDLADLNAAIDNISDGGVIGNDVTVTFDNGATIVFEGVGTGTVATVIEDLVSNPSQIEIL